MRRWLSTMSDAVICGYTSTGAVKKFELTFFKYPGNINMNNKCMKNLINELPVAVVQ